MFKLFMKSRKGFTLVELMVVVVIIGILTAIAIPVYNNVSTTAETNANAANVRTIEGAITTYLASNGGGSYAAVVMTNAGAISGVGITAGNLVPDYLKEMPENPLTSTDAARKYYTKAANGDVAGE